MLTGSRSPRAACRPREHAFNTKKPRAVVNVSDISFVGFVADFGRPRTSQNVSMLDPWLIRGSGNVICEKTLQRVLNVLHVDFAPRPASSNACIFSINLRADRQEQENIRGGTQGAAKRVGFARSGSKVRKYNVHWTHWLLVAIGCFFCFFPAAPWRIRIRIRSYIAYCASANGPTKKEMGRPPYPQSNP